MIRPSSVRAHSLSLSHSLSSLFKSVTLFTCHASCSVVMSATEDLNIVYKCLSEGADDYLLKVCAHFYILLLYELLYIYIYII